MRNPVTCKKEKNTQTTVDFISFLFRFVLVSFWICFTAYLFLLFVFFSSIPCTGRKEEERTRGGCRCWRQWAGSAAERLKKMTKRVGLSWLVCGRCCWGDRRRRRRCWGEGFGIDGDEEIGEDRSGFCGRKTEDLVRREGLWKWGLRVAGLREKEQPKGKGWGVIAYLERESRFSCLGERLVFCLGQWPERWSGEWQPKKNQKPGGATSLGWEKKIRFRFFFLCALKFAKFPLLFLCVLKATIYMQNIVWSPNLIPQLVFFFFCKFDFSYFFGFFLSLLTRIRKIIDFKNNAWKVKRIKKTFENLNSFEPMLKMLKTMQIY